MKTQYIDHVAVQARFATLPSSSLNFIIADCQEAIAAMPDGPKAGYYADEISYAAMELKKRNKNRTL